MPERMFEVLEDQKYTGRHRVYLPGERFPESELSGNEDNLEMALKGSENRDPKIRPVRAKRKKSSKKDQESDSDTSDQ